MSRTIILEFSDYGENLLEYLTNKYQAIPEELIMDAFHGCYEADMIDMDRMIMERIEGNWDMKTAKRCKLPKYIKDACLKCRDYRYCYRQQTLDLEDNND